MISESHCSSATRLLNIAAFLLVGGCGSSEPPIVAIDVEPVGAREVEQPEGWDQELALNIPTDLNPDPDILEIELESKLVDMEFMPGFITPAWTYGGTVP